MEYEIESAKPSLLLLNEYCLLDVFEFLKLVDSINLAGSCRRLRYVADRAFKKYSKFQLYPSELTNVDKWFWNIGYHVLSLKLNCCDVKISISKILGKISKDCKNLRCLSISSWKCDMSQSIRSMYSFDHVEMLTLYDCNVIYVTSFLESFRKLKSLIIDDCLIERNELKMVFENNPSIDNFVYDKCYVESDFDCELLALIPNLESLNLASLGYDNFGKISELNSVLKLNQLTKLRLNCLCKNINKFLRELARKGMVEQMHLEMVQTKDHFFDILTLFDKLQVLVIDSSSFSKLKSSTAWPRKLKQLRLESLYLTHNDLIKIIQQLKSIESIDVHDCLIANEETSYFNDVSKLSQQILYVIEHRKHRLDVVLPFSVTPAGNDLSKQCLVDTVSLRILYSSYEYDSLRIKINFPGFDFL